MIFEWDPAKAGSNVQKHRVSFELATRVFADPFALVELDYSESGEDRLKTLGTADGYTLLVVAHTIQEDHDGTEIVRIISARRAEPKERKRYEQNYSLYS